MYWSIQHTPEHHCEEQHAEQDEHEPREAGVDRQLSVEAAHLIHPGLLTAVVWLLCDYAGASSYQCSPSPSVSSCSIVQVGLMFVSKN